MMNKMLNGKKILVEKMEWNDLKELNVPKSVLDAYNNCDINVYQHAEQKDRFFISLAGEMWKKTLDVVYEIMEVKE